MTLPALLCQRIIDPLLALTFPPLCPACGGFLPHDSRDLCPECRELLEAARLPSGALQRLRLSVRGAGDLDDLVVSFYFDRHSPLQALIHRLKYGGGRAIGRHLGARLGALLARECAVAEFNGVVPVPLHRGRRRERGYNQAAVIAEGVCSVVALPVLESLLERGRSTPSQTGLTAAARMANVSGAFLVPAGGTDRLKGGALILVDDVVTTGATLEACAHALKAAGAVRCIGAALALAR